MFVSDKSKKRGAVMMGILIIIASTIFAGALPWLPYSACGRLQHRYPWDWLMDQDRNTSHVELKAALEGNPIDALAEQLAQVCEKGHARPRHKPREAYAARHPAARNGQDCLVA
jgi:hypothetical protein